MSKPKFTPGPWRVGANGATIFEPKENPRTIGTLTKAPMILNETKANAHLIAAAPCMFEALEKIEKTLLEKHQGTENHTYELMLISGALAKARGES